MKNQFESAHVLSRGLFALLVGLSVGVGSARAAPIFSGFAFGSGTPFGGVTTLDGNTVTLTSTGTEVWPQSDESFRDLVGPGTATVSFAFSEPISEFYLSVSHIRADEYLSDFSLGDPTSLAGTLVDNGGEITTSGSSHTFDEGSGIISFVGIDTTSVTFIISNITPPFTTTPALNVDLFGIVTAPEPSGMALLLPAAAALLCSRPRVKRGA